jgi:hypothetical protein
MRGLRGQDVEPFIVMPSGINIFVLPRWLNKWGSRWGTAIVVWLIVFPTC